MKKVVRKSLTMLLTFVMVFGFSFTVFAAPETSGTVTVSITYGNFAPNGKYVGNGYINTNFYIRDYELSIDDLEYWVDAGLQDIVYCPPVPIPANVLDAIAWAFIENGYYEVRGDWDIYYPFGNTPGGRIYDVPPQTTRNNPPTLLITVDGKEYRILSGTHWQIACSQWDNDLQDWVVKEISTYGSNIKLVDGMKIVFDISPYVIGAPPEGIYFSEESYSVTISDKGDHTTTVLAQAINEYGEVESRKITYSLTAPYTGISIDSNTGVVTVLPDARTGSVQISAACGRLSGITTLYIENSSVIGAPPEGIYFSEESYGVTIPDTGERTTTVLAHAINEYGEVESREITYSLTAPYTGISIDSNTGVVTVLPDARAGSVQISATCGRLSGITTLYIGNSSNNNLTLLVTANETYNASLTANNMERFLGNSFTLIYDPEVLQLNDLCAFTYEKELGAMTIPQAGITITGFSPGEITFSADRSIPPGRKRSGVVNVFSFTAQKSGNTEIRVQSQ